MEAQSILERIGIKCKFNMLILIKTVYGLPLLSRPKNLTMGFTALTPDASCSLSVIQPLLYTDLPFFYHRAFAQTVSSSLSTLTSHPHRHNRSQLRLDVFSKVFPSLPINDFLPSCIPP
jgi:hypothetical protein